MYVDSCTFLDDYGHKRSRHLLRSSYRQDGKVKHDTLGNISSCSDQEITAIKLALKHKGDLQQLGSLQSLQIQQGQSVGALCVIKTIAERVGISKALGSSRMGILALWLVAARLIDQGSRLSAVRLAGSHAACDVLGIHQSFNEDTLYGVLDWCCEQQVAIERQLYRFRAAQHSGSGVYLYDVTSSYFEGQYNELAAYGYNRDGKKGKKQIAVGLLTDMAGYPLAVEVFRGNTQDTQTVWSQIRKLKERFGARKITLVGDRGMLMGPQQQALKQQDCQFITAITKRQIESLLKQGVIQMELFDQELCEVQTEGMRYILRRNPLRCAQIRSNREDMIRKGKRLLAKQNEYLAEHPRAKVQVALRKVREYLSRRRMSRFCEVELSEQRKLSLQIVEEAKAACEKLDGCYVIKTDLKVEDAPAHEIHSRYKDLARVEQAFRSSKTVLLEQRPIFVRKAKRTRGHVLVVMLAYMISHAIRQAWEELDFTIQEGVNELSSVTADVVQAGRKKISIIAKPRPAAAELLKAIDVELPKGIVSRGTKVATKVKLKDRRQLSK